MSANSTALVDKQLPGYSTKLERVGELIETLCAEPARKILFFSEWTSILDLVEPLLKRAKAAFVRLGGSVPQKQRSRVSERRAVPRFSHRQRRIDRFKSPCRRHRNIGYLWIDRCLETHARSDPYRFFGSNRLRPMICFITSTEPPAMRTTRASA